jgi:PAT family beta-lactamase induction signal transducer AmpG
MRSSRVARRALCSTSPFRDVHVAARGNYPIRPFRPLMRDVRDTRSRVQTSYAVESSRMSETAATGGRKAPNPFLYFLLFLPFGATSGFIAVVIGKMASNAGLPDSVVAGMVATNTLPHTWKFLWAPLVDTVWTGRGWYTATNLISSAAIITIGFVPMTADNVWLITGLIFINGLATTFVGMCTESLMARLTPPEGRGAAGGWSQAGNVGGSMVGGFGLMIMNNSDERWLPAVAIGGGLLACSLALQFVEEPPVTDRGHFWDNIKTLGTDIYTLLIDKKRARGLPSQWLMPFPPVFLYVLSGAGILSIALCLMPIGSGGAANLFAVIASDWGATDTTVSFVNGLGSGGAAIVGSLAGGLLSTKMDKRRAYALSGVILALFTFGMAALPRTEILYAAGVLAYYFALGMCYATFTAFVLDIIGHSGGATKYNLFASLANMPIYAMGLFDGYVATEHGRTAMLWVDGLSGIIGAVLLMAIVFILRKRKLDPKPAS